MLKKNYDFKIPVFVLEQGKLKVILEHAPIWWGSDDKIIYDNLILKMLFFGHLVEKIIKKQTGGLKQQIQMLVKS